MFRMKWALAIDGTLSKKLKLGLREARVGFTDTMASRA